MRYGGERFCDAIALTRRTARYSIEIAPNVPDLFVIKFSDVELVESVWPGEVDLSLDV
jgi:hypothetical protein